MTRRNKRKYRSRVQIGKISNLRDSSWNKSRTKRRNKKKVSFWYKR